MASMHRDSKTGMWQIHYQAPNGRKQTLRLKTTHEPHAHAIKDNIERLIVSKRLAVPIDPVTFEWLNLVDDRIYRQLVRVGLADERCLRTLRELTEWNTELHRSRSKPSTIMNMGRATEALLAFFGGGRLVSSIKPYEAEDFRVWLGAKGARYGRPYAATTASRICKRCRQVFAVAVARKTAEQNPFTGMKGWIETNPVRDAYVPRELVETLIGATNNLQLRAVLALVRYAGLRCPSEIKPLSWQDVDWKERRLSVTSPKTELYEGHARRIVPIFPEVLPHLRSLHDQRSDSELLFPSYQVFRGAVAVHLQTLCRDVGVVLWQKPMVNMRASAERDLFKKHAVDDVAAWMGHSPTIALRHYNRAVAEMKAKSAAMSDAA